MSKPEPWFSVEEIARYLAVSKESIYRWLEREKIPAHRVGKQWRFKPSEIDRWVKSGNASEGVEHSSRGTNG
jgi:excisionase family DNA binding protein